MPLKLWGKCCYLVSCNLSYKLTGNKQASILMQRNKAIQMQKYKQDKKLRKRNAKNAEFSVGINSITLITKCMDHVTF